MIKKTGLALMLLFLTLTSYADVTESRDMFFRSGKYNVVVAVLVIIFVFLVVYLFRLDRKVSTLEDKEGEK
ncbi:MAG: CcmD family protein [Bacteroidia bacterium]|nr:CcmD family protein [Bacteroidia bacterium]